MGTSKTIQVEHNGLPAFGASVLESIRNMFAVIDKAEMSPLALAYTREV